MKPTVSDERLEGHIAYHEAGPNSEAQAELVVLLRELQQRRAAATAPAPAEVLEALEIVRDFSKRLEGAKVVELRPRYLLVVLPEARALAEEEAETDAD